MARPGYAEERTLADQVHEALVRLTAELRARGVDSLPTERALAERFGVSRTTVRVGLARLEADGVIRRTRGRLGGAFLTHVEPRGRSDDADLSPRGIPHCVLRDLNTVKGVPQILREQGFTDGTKVISAAVETAPDTISAALRLRPGAKVVSLRRVRFADGETLSVEQVYLSGPSCRRYLGTRLDSLYDGLRQDFGVVVSAAVELIGLGSVGRPTGALLGVPPGTPVLRLERTAYDQEQQPIEYSVDLFRADRTRLRVRSEG